MRQKLLVTLLVLMIAFQASAPTSIQAADPEQDGLWVYLSDLDWANAYTGWVAVGDEGLPTKDKTFPGGPLKLDGRTFEKGLGVFPTSEIEYELRRAYTRFEAVVGVGDDVATQTGMIEFWVYGDDIELFRSGPMRRGQSAHIDVSVLAVSRLRLMVSDARGGAGGDHAMWAEAKLFRPRFAPPADALARQLMAHQKTRNEVDGLRSASKKALAVVRERELARLSFPDRVAISPATDDLAVEGVLDSRSSTLHLSNGVISLGLGFGGESNGALTVVDLATRDIVIYDTTAAVWTSLLRGVALRDGTTPVSTAAFSFEPVMEAGLGIGKRLEARYRATKSNDLISVRLTLYEKEAYFTYQIGVSSDKDGQMLFPGFRFFEPSSGSHFNLGEGELEYITDNSRIRQRGIRDDGVLREDYVGTGQPILMRNTSQKRGLVLAAIDNHSGPMLLTARKERGQIDVSLGLSAYNVGQTFKPGVILGSPRLYVELVSDNDNRTAFTNYKQLMESLYPQMPLPQWVKYQWLSWYVYKMDIDEERLKSQIDYIAENLADLGPWHIVVDAGWYIAEGRDGADWRSVDTDKFPSGLRALVDYAHSKDVKVVLYFSAPYLTDREREGDWLGLKEIIREHPEWLRPYSEGPEGKGYLYDFTNRGFQQYLREVMEDFFVVYDVDGMKIDGLGNGQGTEIFTMETRSFFINRNVLGTQTMQSYRQLHDLATSLKKDVYLESGWTTPVMANRYANTFRYGDESPYFNAAYPFGGLVQHVDHAIMQKTMLGQRPNMGAIWGDPNRNWVNRAWLGAGLALGTQVVLGFDLTTMRPNVLSQYRSLLTHYNAFQGDTEFGGPFYSNSFATTANGITYLGAINREKKSRADSYKLSDFGLDPGKAYIVFDAQTLSANLASGTFSATIPASNFRLFLLRSEPGVLWTNSSFTVERRYGALGITAGGPNTIEGSMQIYVPNATRVLMDGKELKEARTPSFGFDQYQYDRRTGLLKLRYRHDKQHTIEVRFEGETLSELAEAQLGVRVWDPTR